MKIWKKALLFYIGGMVYMALELLWRGKTWGSMFLAGGICFLLIGQLGLVRPRLPLLPRAVAGAGIVTMVELGFGLLVNRDYTVWDYRNQPANLWGQICPGYGLLWVPVSLAAMLLYEALSRFLDAAADREVLRPWPAEDPR